MKLIASIILITSISSLYANTTDHQHMVKEHSYSECFATTMWMKYGKDVNNGEIPKTVKIPEGWAPIGGGFGVNNAFNGNGEAVMIICKIK